MAPPPGLFLAALNPTGRKVRTTITVDAKALGFDPAGAAVTELINDKPLSLSAADGTLEISLDLDTDQPASLRITAK